MVAFGAFGYQRGMHARHDSAAPAVTGRIRLLKGS